MNRIVSSIKRYGGFCFSSSRLSLIQSRPFSTSTDNRFPRKQQRNLKGGFDQRESDSEQKYHGNTSYNDRRFNDNTENRTASERYSDKRYNNRSFDDSNRNRDRYEGERGDRNRKFTERKQHNNYENHNSENRPTSDTYAKRNYSSNHDTRTISDRYSERRSGRVKFDEYSNRNRDRTTFNEKVFGDRVDQNHNNEGLMNALNELKVFYEIIPSPLNLTLKFPIPPFNVEFPPIMTGDLLEFIQKREPTLLELTACFSTIDLAVNLRDIYGTERKLFLRQTSFRIPACDKKIVSDNYKSQDEIHFKNKDFSRVLGLANELLKGKGEQDAYNVWKNMSNSEKRDIQVVDIVDMLFPNGSITLSPSTPKNVDLISRVESYTSIGSVPWSIYLYATHIFLYRYSQYFRAKEAGIFRCRSTIKVCALVNDLSQLDDEKKLSKFVDICKSKLEAFARIDRQREQPNATQDKLTRTPIPSTPDTFWLAPQFIPFISLLKWQALLTGYECSHPKIASSLLLPIGIANDSKYIHAALVSLGVFEPHHNIFKLKAEFDAEIKFDFPKKLDKATNSLLLKFSSHVPTKLKDGREDMRDHTIFTIDSLDTVEIDDGVSVTDDGWFHVHIADPTKWFKPHSDLDIVARHRVTSIYLPEIKVSMLPLDVSKEVFSILPDRVSYALTFSIKLAEDGHIEDYKITPSIVQKIRKLDYFDVDCILENDYNPLSRLTDKEKNMIHRLYEGAVKHSEWRRSQGAVFVHLPEVKIEVFDDGKQVKIRAINQNTKSRMLVSEMMLLCGQCASFFGIQNNVPLPYRFQTAPEFSDEVKDFFKTLPENTRPFHQVRFLTAASVSSSPQRHYGVGVDSYVQASSPIRRYGDILIHYQIKAILRREDPPFSLSDIEKIIPLMVDVSKNIKDLQRCSNNFWTLRYLHQQGQQMYKALILGIEVDLGKISLFLIEVAYQLKVPIPVNLNITPGQYVLLQVLKVGLYQPYTRIVRVLEDNEV